MVLTGGGAPAQEKFLQNEWNIKLCI